MSFNWTLSDLQSQLSRAHDAGWIDHFEYSANRYGFDPDFLIAIASRETNMHDIAGDYHAGKPHGFGLMQVDIGTDPGFCAAWKPGQVEGSIDRGTQILASKRRYLGSHGITDDRAIAAAYNTGEGNVVNSVQLQRDTDFTTAGGNYGTDVMARMAALKQLRAA